MGIIIDEACLDLFRGPGRCSWCGQICKNREPHHYIPRGCGGGSRLDVPINLIALGSSRPYPECGCHNDAENGVIPRCSILAVIAARENRMQDDIERELYRLLREPGPKMQRKHKPRVRRPVVACLLCAKPVRTVGVPVHAGRLHRKCWDGLSADGQWEFRRRRA